MAVKFPGRDGLKAMENLLNTDEQYREIVSNWEHDLYFIFQLNGNPTEQLNLYPDLWN